jgi:hypothetical protein
MSTTLNGQLMLTMLAEDLVLRGGCRILMINTDGLECYVPKNKLNLYDQICKEWMHKTKLELEFVDYHKIVLRDINNYIAVDSKGKVKYKGAFEINKDYHKDNSFKIIPIAISKYFIEGIPIKDTIEKHTNVLDFCGRQKFGRDSKGILSHIDNNVIIDTHVGKNLRYYITKPEVKNACRFIKHYNKGTTEIIHVGYYVMPFNTKINYSSINSYNINYSFYINECMKEIRNIKTNQLSLIL